jgi:hypothetical protein
MEDLRGVVAVMGLNGKQRKANRTKKLRREVEKINGELQEKLIEKA